MSHLPLIIGRTPSRALPRASDRLARTARQNVMRRHLSAPSNLPAIAAVAISVGVVLALLLAQLI